MVRQKPEGESGRNGAASPQWAALRLCNSRSPFRQVSPSGRASVRLLRHHRQLQILPGRREGSELPAAPSPKGHGFTRRCQSVG